MEFRPVIEFTAKLNEKEYTLITRALGFMAGLPGIRLKEGDIGDALELNRQMLNGQAGHYKHMLQIVEAKIAKAEEGRTNENYAPDNQQHQTT